MISLLVCTATGLESSLLASHVEVLRTGIGPVNAAYALTRYLDRHDVARIVVCGIGGAYPNSGLAIGDVACASSECYADLGSESPEGFLDLAAMGFPLINGPAPVYNTLPVQILPHEKQVKFATVNTCTGLDPLAEAIEQRTRAAVENMEGAAVAHVAALAGIPVGEIRGISNMTGRRDRAAWRVKEAAGAAQLALISWLKTL